MRRSLAVFIPAATVLCCTRAVVPAPLVGAGGSSATGVLPAVALDAALVEPAVAGEDGAGWFDRFDASDATNAVADDPMALHREAPEGLRALMGAAASIELPIGGGPWRPSQGHRAVSHHAIGRHACVDGLRNVSLQTPAQRSACEADAMVPVWSRAEGPRSARFCIDIFEFPNMPCELPFVFVTPPQAEAICRMQGKRLCTQDEWNLACRGDPDGGADRIYAYGNDLDLTICNTNKSRVGGPRCDVTAQDKLWATCGTNTEPAGAFPRCRSRFGVFDQHGNVAEIMTRIEPADHQVMTQLKGSAFFYVDVAETPGDPRGYWTRYPDDCNFDPRWHVERLEGAQHLNYHLGFRCCKSLDRRDAGEP